MHLDPFQIQILNHYLTTNGLVHTEVREDILDHMCTEIEHLMEEGQEFEKAYESARQQFSPSDISDIQRDTTYYLTIKSTIAMIKGIFISGYLAVCFWVMSFGFEGFFRFIFQGNMELAYLLTGLLKVTGVTIFCFVFLPLLFTYGYKRFTANLVR